MSKQTIQQYLQNVESSQGKSNGFPLFFKYDYDETNASCIIEMPSVEDKDSKKVFRRLEPWAFAFVNGLKENTNISPKKIKFYVEQEVKQENKNFEAFKRRVSFLSFNNKDITIAVFLNSQPENLYTEQELFNPPKDELIREFDGQKERHGNDKEGRLEKDFQVFLFGGRKDTAADKANERTNERLAVLGEDFFNLKRGRIPILREFPTGVFKNKISEGTNRILPTEFIDIVTLNKYGNLSIIELKLNDSELGVISQLLDYALFFRRYKYKLLEDLKKHKFKNLGDKPIVCYVANNHFHPKFDGILQYYKTNEKKYGFELKKVILGHTNNI